MKRIVAFGDSIAFGEHISTDERWPTHLAHTMPEWNVLVRAVCADTTRLALERFDQDVARANPDIVVIQFGHNDCSAWDGKHPRVSVPAYEANLVEMVEKAGVQCVLCSPHRTNKDFAYEQRLKDYAGAVWGAASRFPTAQVAVADAYDAGQFSTLDGLHLDAEGHRKMAGLVLGAVDSLTGVGVA